MGESTYEVAYARKKKHIVRCHTPEGISFSQKVISRKFPPEALRFLVFVSFGEAPRPIASWHSSWCAPARTARPGGLGACASAQHLPYTPPTRPYSPTRTRAAGSACGVHTAMSCCGHSGAPPGMGGPSAVWRAGRAEGDPSDKTHRSHDPRPAQVGRARPCQRTRHRQRPCARNCATHRPDQPTPASPRRALCTESLPHPSRPTLRASQRPQSATPAHPTPPAHPAPPICHR